MGVGRERACPRRAPPPACGQRDQVAHPSLGAVAGPPACPLWRTDHGLQRGPREGPLPPSPAATPGKATCLPEGGLQGLAGLRPKCPLPGPKQLPGPGGAVHNPVLRGPLFSSHWQGGQGSASWGRAPDLEGGWCGGGGWGGSQGQLDSGDRRPGRDRPWSGPGPTRRGSPPGAPADPQRASGPPLGADPWGVPHTG